MGPERCAIHFALSAQRSVESLSQDAAQAGIEIVADKPPENLVRCIDFRYLTDALTPQEAVEMLWKKKAG